ncbi:MAG: hypothetical protein WKF47_03970 [Geodermatophilaceae bacterium]
MCVDRVRRCVVHDPIDSGRPSAADSSDRRTARGVGGIDGTVEAQRQPRIEVEPVELVQQRGGVAIRRVRGAVGYRQGNPPAGELRRVGHREAVAREQRHRCRGCDRRPGGRAGSRPRGGQRQHGGQAGRQHGGS